MRIALDPAMLATDRPESVISAVAEAGYRYVEFSNRDDVIGAFGPVRASRPELEALRLAARTAGVEFISVAVIQAWSDPDEEIRSRAVAWWREGIRAAVELGCGRINTELSGDPARPEASAISFRRSLDELMPTLEREDIELVVEPHPHDFVETLVGAIELIESVGSSRLRYLHCIPHTFYLGGTAASQVEYARDRFDHLHVADTFRPVRTIVNPTDSRVRVHQHFDIGRGELDWQEISAALQAIGFDGVCTVQVFGWEERATESFRENREAVERLFNVSAARPGRSASQ